MKNLQKMGGIAALYEAAAYVLGMVFYMVVLDYSGVVEPIQKVAFLVDNQASLYILTLFVYVVFSVFLDGCPGSRGAAGCVRTDSNRVVRLAGDRHVARQPKRGSIKTGRVCDRCDDVIAMGI